MLSISKDIIAVHPVSHNMLGTLWPTDSANISVQKIRNICLKNRFHLKNCMHRYVLKTVKLTMVKRTPVVWFLLNRVVMVLMIGMHYQLGIYICMLYPMITYIICIKIAETCFWISFVSITPLGLYSWIKLQGDQKKII